MDAHTASFSASLMQYDTNESLCPIDCTMTTGCLQFFNNLLPQQSQDAVWSACTSSRWSFGNTSVNPQDPQFWKMELDGDAAVDALWAAAQALCESFAQRPLRVIRQYANGHTYGLGGQIHVDDVLENHYTFLYYPMPMWQPEWGGETVFYQPSGDIAAAIAPIPNRGVFFDSRIPHTGRAPNRSFGGLRVTIAFKLGPA